LNVNLCSKRNEKGAFITIIFLFFMSRFFNIAFINNSDLLSFIYSILSKLIVFLVLVKYFTRGKMSKFMIILLTYYFFIFLSTLINDGNIRRLLMSMYPIFGMCCLIELKMRYSPISLLKPLTNLLGVLSIINFILALLNKDLFADEWFFLGPANQVAVSLIILSVVSFLLKEMGYLSSKKVNFYIIINSISLIIIFSGNNLIAWGVFLLGILFINKKTVARFFSFKKVVVFFGIFFVSIVVFEIQNLFGFFIEGVLNKNLTFTNRTYIWEMAIQSIKEKPIIGHGVKDTVMLFHLFLVRPNAPTVNSYLSTHNQILHILYEGGILALSWVVALIFISGKTLKRYNDKKIIAIISIGILSLLFIFMAETIGIDSIIILACIAFNMKTRQLCNEKNEKNLLT